MEYPAINLSLEALKAREGKPLNDCDLAEFKFLIDSYQPGVGGSGRFRDQAQVITFQDLNELAEILVNQSDLTAEAFYYPDALATCGEIEEELATDGMTCNWKDQMIISEFTGRHPARARVCYYYPKDAEAIKAIAVLRDGTTIADFRPLQNK
ncbi:MAG TPA: hypothetical protein DDZ53_00070 [Firmicutes bacterium]|nr:hypothetical protein [Bacillota bacterium]